MAGPATEKPAPNGCLVAVRDDLDVFEARRVARVFAGLLGFDRQAREELAIVVSELASNILKHGVSGDLLFEEVTGERRGSGVRVTAHDVGPPIADLDLALRDGYSDTGPIDPMALPRRRGFGCGLGAVLRFSDSFEYLPGEGEKRIRVVRYANRPKRRFQRRAMIQLLIGLKIMHLLAASVWIGGGLTAPRDIQRTLSMGPPHTAELMPRLRRISKLMNGAALTTVVSGLCLVAVIGLAQVPHRIHVGLVLTLAAVATGRWLLRPVLAEIARAIREPLAPAQVERILLHFRLVNGVEHALRLAVLVLMVYPFRF